MAYIGPEPNPGQNREVDDISSSFNGSTTAFTLQVNSQNVSPGSANAIVVSLGGVVQNPGTDYTIAASTITFTTAPASGLSFFGLVLGQGIDTATVADGSVSTIKIADQAVTLAKLPHGTGSNDGKFLRANNGADPTFETVSGTTINNNADNRIITGSGTANTLEGEANLTFDGTDLDILSGNSSMRLTCSSNTPVINFNANSVSDAARITIAESSGGATFKFENKNTGGTLNENFRIHTNGQASFGTTSSGYGLTVINTTVQSNPTCFFKSEGFDNVEVLRLQNDRANSSSGVVASMVHFHNSQGTKVGSIEGGTSTAYNTTSDYRVKENIVTISDGITRLKTLKPKRFNFKASPTVTVDGFLAHEVTAVPEAISGEKDAMARVLYKEGDTIPDGKKIGDFKEYSSTEIDPQGLDQSKLVPLLTAALQEAVTKIEVLETKVAALEAA
jgi:hypothetical protein